MATYVVNLLSELDLTILKPGDVLRDGKGGTYRVLQAGTSWCEIESARGIRLTINKFGVGLSS